MKTKLLTTIALAFSSFTLIAQPGSLDLSFDPVEGANHRIYDTKFNTDGRILLGGIFSEYQYYLNDVPLVSVESNGNIYSSFYAGGIAGTYHDVLAINELSTGDIIISGAMYNYNSTGVNYSYISRNSSLGGYNATFSPPLLLNGIVRGLAVQSDNKIIYGAEYTDPMNTTITLYKLERLNSSNGSVDATFNVSSGPNSVVRAIAIQADGKVIIGGDFTSYNGTAKNCIARLNSNGTIDNTFNVGSGFNSFASIKGIKIQSDGKILVVGEFTTYNGISRSGIVRLNTNGSIDNTFNPGTGAVGVSETGVYDLAIQSDGKILISGDFLIYNGTNIKRIARINSNGTLDTTFNPGTSANNTIRSILIQPDGKIIIAGDFTTYNGTTRNRVARLLNCTAPTITGTTPNNRCDAGTVTLGATASAGTLSWYGASAGGSVLGTGTSFVTPSISSTTTYYVESSNGGCTSPRTAVTATVNTTPTITGTTPNNRCDAGTVTLGATASAGTMSWYAASTGGSVLGTGTSFVTPSISSTTTYYVESSNGGCTSPRTAVTATVNTTPTITGTTPNNRCDAGTVTLGATASAGTLSWYAASAGGSVLGTGTSFVTPSISSTTTYYVESSNGGCTSPRTAVVATVNNSPTATVNQTGNTLTVQESGLLYQWVDCNNANAPISGEIGQSFDVTVNGNYAVEVTENGCVTTSNCTNVTVTNVETFSTKNELSIYPNPVKDGRIKVASNNQIKQVKIYDAIGKVVYYENINNEQQVNIVLPELEKGIYFIQVNNEVQKIYIQ